MIPSSPTVGTSRDAKPPSAARSFLSFSVPSGAPQWSSVLRKKVKKHIWILFGWICPSPLTRSSLSSSPHRQVDPLRGTTGRRADVRLTLHILTQEQASTCQVDMSCGLGRMNKAGCVQWRICPSDRSIPGKREVGCDWFLSILRYQDVPGSSNDG